MTKMTRDQARAYHPSMTPIRCSEDFEQTVRDAQAVVETGKNRLRVVGEDERARPVLLLTKSRERRARRMDAFAVALLMALAATFGCILMLLAAPHAKADVSDQITDYTSLNGPLACEVLDDYNSVSGLIGLMQGIAEDGWTPYEAGQIAALSVFTYCPRHIDLLDRFIALYGDKGAVA